LPASKKKEAHHEHAKVWRSAASRELFGWLLLPGPLVDCVKVAASGGGGGGGGVLFWLCRQIDRRVLRVSSE